MLLGWIRWLRNTVTFLIRGNFPEQFCNRCRRRGIVLWGLSLHPEGMEASSYAGAYRHLRSIARESRVKLRLTAKHGPYFYWFRYRKCYGRMVGLCAGILLFWLASTRIWWIPITGCAQLSPVALRQALSELGLSEGVAAASLDARALAKALRLTDDRIGWVAVNIVGCTAQVSLRERVPTPEPLGKMGRARNVVAASDGLILEMEVAAGQPLVKVGDTVQAGQLLVSGIAETTAGVSRLCDANATILAEVRETASVSVPLTQLYWEPVGKPQRRPVVWVLGQRYPFPHGRQAEPSARCQSHYDFAKGYPLWLGWEEITPMALQKHILSPLEAKERAISQLSKFYTAAPTKIFNKQYTEQTENGIFTLTETLHCVRNIASLRPISIFSPEISEKTTNPPPKSPLP